MALVINSFPLEATFCLTMIVKDESHCIRRLLDSCLPLLNYTGRDFIRVVDTGSTDDTPGIICAWANEHSVDAIVFHEPWIDFATNRNNALLYAQSTKASHLLLLDADEILHITEEQAHLLRKKLYNNETMFLCFPMVYGNNICTRVNLVKNVKDKYIYKYPIHEELVYTDSSSTNITLIGNPENDLSNPYVTTPQDGKRSQNPNKAGDDIKALSHAYSEDGNPRHLFFIAQMLRVEACTCTVDIVWEKVMQAYANYLKDMEGNYQPYCYVAALWVARIADMLGDRSFEDQIKMYLDVYQLDPSRPEALGNAACYSMEHDRKGMAKDFARRITELPQTKNYAFYETKWTDTAKKMLVELQGVF
jgi:glycosyltransferase involved in cell wall biosynthesis